MTSLLMKALKKGDSDSVASRRNRILGSKIIFMIVVITAWCWSKDKMNGHQGEERPYPKFVTKSCWMRGLFLYKELVAEPRPSREFGIPDDIGDDHIQNNCLIRSCAGPGCKKMEGFTFRRTNGYPFSS